LFVITSGTLGATAPITMPPARPKGLVGVQGGYRTRAEAARKLHVRRATLDAALAAVPKEGAENAPAAVLAEVAG
jgi:hypothetical protein